MQQLAVMGLTRCNNPIRGFKWSLSVFKFNFAGPMRVLHCGRYLGGRKSDDGRPRVTVRALHTHFLSQRSAAPDDVRVTAHRFSMGLTLAHRGDEGKEGRINK
eukprot:GHVU01177640.1.p1 GENE.GHVU01177640.1~~GHVU01177640.1.p1  ORF type:complete len:103 (+),score=9.78 GHVU01177640.1:234-542(+)